jgi:alkanesulfonate monooxygenase SsuD/methylene tetrahydromethanopterin reductase-like flavin-dependent oxidoreductase (luciferase family)
VDKAASGSWARPSLQLGSGVGVYLPSNQASYAQLCRVWDWLDTLNVDYLAVEDHLISASPDPDASQLECWALLAAMAERTSKPIVSALVSPAAFRNPAVVAKAAVTIDHISNGRFMLGLGAGWFAEEYWFARLDYRSHQDRLNDLEILIDRCREIWADTRCRPAPVNGTIPVLVGGTRRTTTIPLVARAADAWNAEGPVKDWVPRNEALTTACEAIGRDPSSLVRTALIWPEEIETVSSYRKAGADLIIICVTPGIPRADLERLVRQAAGSGRCAPM